MRSHRIAHICAYPPPLPSQIKSKNRGGLLYPCAAFYDFAIAIEKIYLFNLTDAKLDAFPSNLAFLINDAVKRSEEPRAVMSQCVRRCLPSDMQDQPVPEEFYTLVFKKHGMMRAKDLAKSLDRAHAAERSGSATAANVPIRVSLAVASATAIAAAKKARPNPSPAP
jgi:hypothetical protein